MALNPGQKLGPYEIVSPLGAGGMGEVYRARDTRLERDVAIKVLPAAMSNNPAIEARFEREAKTVSSLNHPHICVLHDVGHEEGIAFLVMELLEGETLADRVGKGPLPTSEVLKYGGQIADALNRAHRAGVVHRDLKPANVMLTRAGAKLMDFGLARGGDAGGTPGTETAPNSASQSPTVAQPLTAEGAIVGTFQYMAPEQLEGKETDARADLWAFGCVLYEMATGKRAFDGASQASLIGSIMHADPRPISALAPLAPLELDRLVAACLTKNVEDRVQSAHDLKLQLKWLAEGASSTTSGMHTQTQIPQSVAAKRPGWLVPVAVAAVSVALTILVMLLGPFDNAPPPREERPQRYILGSATMRPTSVPKLSPDGTFVVISVRDDTSSRLYRRDLSSFQMTPIPGTDDGAAPFFSPDGAWIGFVTSDSVKRVPVGGGISQVVASGARPSAGEWGENGFIYVTERNGGASGNVALGRVPESGGEVEVIATLDMEAGEYESWLPEILPDGETVLISILGNGNERIVAVGPDGLRETVVEGGFLGRYIEPGYLVYVDEASEAVVVAPFDASSVQLTGSAIPLTEQVDGIYCFDVAADGKLVYVPTPRVGEGSEIIWLDRKGKATLALETRAPWIQPRLSPNGKQILLRKTANDCELWMADVERGSLARLVHDGDVHDAIWGPAGKRILYREMNAGKLVTQTTGGMRKIETIAQGQEAGNPGSWSAGGNLFAYTLRGKETGDDIWVRVMDGSSSSEPFLVTEFNERNAAISPDGNWVAYMSDETGSQEVFVRSYPDSGAAWQVSTSAGRHPIWSRDGKELFFVSGRTMMVVQVQSSRAGAFAASRPEELFEGNLGSSRVRDYDVTADGGFVSVRGGGDAEGASELRMLLSWQQEMARTSGGGVRH